MLRVIGGKYGKRLLEQPPLEVARPTMDRIREAIFSMIQFNIHGSVVLDLFAGSGAFAIEFVSRGAIKAIAVDNHKKAIEVIKQNVESLKIDNLAVVQTDALTYLESAKGLQFDFIVLDPPYDSQLQSKALAIIAENKLLKNFGLIILEIKNGYEFTVPRELVIQKTKKYGEINIFMIANNL